MRRTGDIYLSERSHLARDKIFRINQDGLCAATCEEHKDCTRKFPLGTLMPKLKIAVSCLIILLVSN